jgi:RNA polymerase sigma factor (TIGR02999 family)
MDTSQAAITHPLEAWGEGDKAALDALVPLVHKQLRRLAHRYMRQERAGVAFQTTELVNEVYLKLVDSSRVRWNDRAHFFAISAQLMRRILVDFARSGPIRLRCDCFSCDLGIGRQTYASRFTALRRVSHSGPYLANVLPGPQYVYV